MTETMTDRAWYEGIPIAEYLKAEGVSRSDLHTIGTKSPLEWLWKKEQPDSSTPAMALGTACHLSILEPEEFERLVTSYDGVRNSKAKAYQEFLSNHEGMLILKPAEYARAVEVGHVVRTLKGPKVALRTGNVEQSMFWSEGGVRCKARPDFWAVDRGFVVDVKTTSSLDDRDLVSSVYKYGYDLQASMWMAGSLKLSDAPPIKASYILWVSTTGPVQVRMWRLDARWLARGQRLFEKYLGIYRQCVETGEWPGYPTDIVTAPFPKWVERAEEEDAA